MSEIIIKIEDTLFGKGYQTKEGILIETDKQEIRLGIEDGQSCCENSGYFTSEDDFKEFIGAELLDIRLTDTLLKSVEGHPDGTDEYFEGGLMFVDLITSKGVLQFVAYNEHNGYYGHEACVISTQLKHDEVL